MITPRPATPSIPPEVLEKLASTVAPTAKTGEMREFLESLEIGVVHLSPYSRSNMWSRISHKKYPIKIKIKTTEHQGELYVMRIS